MMKKLFSAANDHTGWIGKQFQVGRYLCTVESLIAEGGFALVFVVRTSSGHRCALKRTSVNDEVDLQVCRQEIQIMKMLSGHKNAIMYLDSSITTTQPGIFEVLMLMEFCKAGSVIDLMNENLSSGFSETLVLKIFCDTCEAIALMHHNDPPVLHRDLKVENVLGKESGDFVLCDFGSARFGKMDPNVVGIRQVEEDLQKYTTVAYRAPEMVDLYAGHVIDTKSDVWALGCLLYKLCFFVPPFGESTLAIQSGQFTIPEDSKFSKELHSLITYILNPDPIKRPDVYQVAYLAFMLAKKSCPVPNKHNSPVSPSILQCVNIPSKDTQDTRTSTQAFATKSGPVMTSVAPRGRPVTTSLAPRQRPKGNNQLVEGQDDTVAAFKQESPATHIQSNLKEVSAISTNHSQGLAQNQLGNQYGQFNLSQSCAGTTPQEHEQYMLMQQQQQRELLLRQQQQQQQQIIQQQYLQQQQQQQQYMQQQQFLKQQQQQQEFLLQQQQQREMLLRQEQEIAVRQHQEMVARQQQEEIMRARQEQYIRLHKLREEEEQSKLRMQKILQQNKRAAMNDDDFNPRQEPDPRLCHSVEPMARAPVEDQRFSPNPFEDDFGRSSSGVSNPFVRRASDDNLNPFQMKKKTHHRSRSDTFTRLAENRKMDPNNTHVSSHKSKSQKSTRLPPIPASAREPLTIDTTDSIQTETSNPFIQQKDTITEKSIESVNQEAKINEEENRKADLRTTKNTNIKTGVLLELDDADDEQFNKLQLLLEDLGVMDELDHEINNDPNLNQKKENLITIRSSSSGANTLDVSRTDASPLLSPAMSPPQGERKYVYQRTSSCSSSNAGSSDDSVDDENNPNGGHAYVDCNSVEAHMDPGSEIISDYDERMLGHTAEKLEKAWSQIKAKDTEERDIFDAAPFAAIANPQVSSQKENVTSKNETSSNDGRSRYSSGMKIKRQNARKIRQNSPTVVLEENPFSSNHSPFDDQFAGNTKPPVDNDPFGMAPMKIPKTKAKKQNYASSSSKEKPIDPFDMAPVGKVISSERKKSSGKVYDDPFGSAPFVKTTNRSTASFKDASNTELNARIQKRRQLPNIPATGST